LPKSIHQSGALKGKDENDRFSEHIKIESELIYDISLPSETSRNKITYSFNEVPQGSVIILNISEDLKERLKLPAESLKIIVR